MSAFAAAIDALFADPNVALDALYGADETPVRAILRAPDRTLGFGATQLHAPTAIVDVRVAEVAAPAEGDRVAWGGDVYIVQGTPQRDRERLVWSLEVRPNAP
jgi:hypothetical protein